MRCASVVVVSTVAAASVAASVGALAPPSALADPAPSRLPSAPGTSGTPGKSGTPDTPGTPGASTTPAPQPVPKKDRAAQAKSTKHGPPPAPGSKPAKLVNLYNSWTKEWLAVDAIAPPPRDTIDRFLRDHFTNKPTAMEPRLVDIVVAAAANFHSDVVDIVSGFRHPKYNLILRKKGHQVARDSQHTHGNAIDFYVPHVTTAALHTWAKAQKIGGVGLYAESGFVHMDTGRIRYWSGE